MKFRHTKVTNPMTYVRLLFIFVASIVFTFLTPYNGHASESFLFYHSFNAGVIYAVICGFVMSLAQERKRSLHEAIALELNKVRRLYHLAYHMANGDPSLQPWFKKLEERLSTYLHFFQVRSFSDYEQSHALFRRVTYQIYSLTSQTKKYAPELYQSLLDTTGEATEARQMVSDKKDRRIGLFQWFTIIVVALTNAFLVAAGTDYSLYGRLVTAFFIFNLFLVADMLYEYDTSNRKEDDLYSHMYVENKNFMYDAVKEG